MTDIIGGGIDPVLPDDDDTPDLPALEVFTAEQQEKIMQVRLMIGDSPSSPFYPLFQDEEIAQFLKMTKWNVRRATRYAAIAASMNFSQMVYRERTGDIEVWNNVSLQYLKALDNIINENTVDAWGNLVPYFGGIDWCKTEEYRRDRENVRSPLVTISDPLYIKEDKVIRIEIIETGNSGGGDDGDPTP